MNSPAEDILLTLIALDNTSVSPKYQEQVINAIQRGYLTEGQVTRTRKFSGLLDINRNTAVAV